MLRVKVPLWQKNAGINKIKSTLLLQDIFSESKRVCVCLHTKFQASSINLTSFRLSSPLPQNEPLKNPPRLRLNNNGSNPTNLGGNPLYYNLDMVQDTANFKTN